MAGSSLADWRSFWPSSRIASAASSNGFLATIECYGRTAVRLAAVPWWPFKRKAREDEFFTSTGGAQVAPAAPPVIETQGAAPTQTQTAPPPPAGAPPPDVVQQLAAAGIHIDPNAPVQVATQTTQLTGDQATQFLSQLGTLLGGVTAGGTLQLHPGIQIMSGGRMLESPEQLKTTGVDAQATVKDLEAKPVTIGDTHVVKLKLEVTKPGGQPYEVTTAALVPAKVTETFAEGKTFPAKVDPNDPQQVLVIWPD